MITYPTLGSSQGPGNGDEACLAADGEESLPVAGADAVAELPEGARVPVPSPHHQDLLPSRLRVQDCGVVLPAVHSMNVCVHSVQCQR